ncbi:MAG: SxtJ family membrane protein [Salibacteraceae bacterium]
MPRSKVLETHLIIATGFLVIYLIQFWKEDTDPNPILLYISMGVGIIGIFIPPLAKWVNWGWYKLAEGMGYVMSRVILSIVFFLFLTPIALLNRMVNKDKLGLRRKQDTYWKTRSHTFQSEDLDNPW